LCQTDAVVRDQFTGNHGQCVVQCSSRKSGTSTFKTAPGAASSSRARSTVALKGTSCGPAEPKYQSSCGKSANRGRGCARQRQRRLECRVSHSREPCLA
jgi:hypothetical protein